MQKRKRKVEETLTSSNKLKLLKKSSTRARARLGKELLRGKKLILDIATNLCYNKSEHSTMNSSNATFTVSIIFS